MRRHTGAMTFQLLHVLLHFETFDYLIHCSLSIPRMFIWTFLIFIIWDH